ncbi:hypothetical protein P692DRAFT_2066814 [Suillus brevipes Sb2]|nr:hypothetical protein P692DRAFT_2066814 [Suillus brevipes Sb2]
MRTYLVSAVAFLSALAITNQLVFGLIVSGSHGAITIAWKNDEITYVMDRNVRHYDIYRPSSGTAVCVGTSSRDLRTMPWSKLAQRQHSAEDTRLAADQQTERKQMMYSR